jgi:NAD(P)-dependent dehydrogenase (short-subunit alcohol dehydrogenase family)
MGNFDEKVAVVTGGTRGIGAAVTASLAHGGAHVAAGYHRSQESAERFRAEMVDRGRIDILVNNAGVTVDKTVRKMTVEDWHAVLRINLSGAFYMVKAVLDHMLERGSGRIVNISSVIGETGNIGQANYAASKSGLVGFTKSLALETARRGITVNCVAPGFIDTEMVAAVPKEALQQIVDRIPVRRLGTAAEVARVVRFLSEEEAGYITGAVFTVNGGFEM